MLVAALCAAASFAGCAPVREFASQYDRSLTLSYGSESAGRVAYTITHSGSVPAGAQKQARELDAGIRHDFSSPNPLIADGKNIVSRERREGGIE